MIFELLSFSNIQPLEGMRFASVLLCVALAIAIIGVMIGVIAISTLFSGSIGETFVFGALAIITIVSGFGILGDCNSAYDSFNSQRQVTITEEYQFTTSTIQEIVSLSGGTLYSSSGSGRFLLGSGTYTENGHTDLQYFFYKRIDGGYQIDHISAENVVIREDNETNPNIEWIWKHTVSEKKQYLDNGQITGGDENSVLLATYVHVPQGTVIKEYTAR